MGLPLSRGASGEAVRDVQRRLAGLNHDVGGDEPGDFGPATEAAVRAFQVQRGLRIDGICGVQTWSALVEAGFRLGDRLLYHRQRLLRGDDVSALQRTLGSMGFDAGRVDGIFGPKTAGAVSDFQRNAGLVVDAICGPATLQALDRLASRSGHGPPVVGIREIERLRGGPRSLDGRRVVVGHQGGVDALADAVARALIGAGAAATVAQHPDGSELAAVANGVEADVFLGLALDADSDGCATAYYAHPKGWESPEGRRLAELLQAGLSATLDGKDNGVKGMTVPVLLETRMPAVLCELAPPAAVVAHSAEVATEVTRCLERWIAHCHP